MAKPNKFNKKFNKNSKAKNGPVKREITKAERNKNKKLERTKKDESKPQQATKAEALSFDEDSIKNRITAMLEDFKKEGGVLELGDEERDASDVAQSDDDDDGEVDSLSANVKRDESPDGDEDEDGEQDGDDAAEEGGEKEKDRKKQREKRKFDFELNNRTIFVGNLPKTYEKNDVIKVFKSCGQIENARIRSVVPDKEKLAKKVALVTKRIHPKVDFVNAYVAFAPSENNESVTKALAMNGKIIDGHHIRVDRATRPQAKRETLTSRKKSVFVGNLRFDLRDDDLINHFKKVGPVNHVRIVRDSATGMGKGFGFVVFQERASAKKALELNESNFMGRQLRVKWVEEENSKNKKNTKPQGAGTTKPVKEDESEEKEEQVKQVERPVKTEKKPFRKEKPTKSNLKKPQGKMVMKKMKNFAKKPKKTEKKRVKFA